MQHDLINDLPISEAAFARMLRLTPAEVQAFATGLPADRRARLAMFCYARAHLRETGLLIARDCNRLSLSREGGQAGAALFDQAKGGWSEGAQLAPTRRAAVSLWRPVVAARTIQAPIQDGGCA